MLGFSEADFEADSQADSQADSYADSQEQRDYDPNKSSASPVDAPGTDRLSRVVDSSPLLRRFARSVL